MQRRHSRFAALTWVLILGVGCAASGDPLNVGSEPDAGHGGTSGSGGTGAFDGGSNRLIAEIQAPPDTMAIEIVTITCDDSCADVIAVAHGGNPGYTFAWSDGLTTAAREICVSDDTTITVTVRDTAVSDPEFAYAGQQATVSVTADVIECPDHDGGVDGGAIGRLCLDNPSFEGTARTFPGQPFDGAPWDPCPNGVNSGAIGNETSSTSYVYIPAAHGNTYGVVGTNSGFGGQGFVAQTLCEPIPAGASRSFLVQLARMAPAPNGTVDAMNAQVQVFGGDGARCMETALLWTSPILSESWTEHCVTITPSVTTTQLAFHPLGDGNPLFLGLMGAFIDNIVPVDSCPSL